MARARHGKTKKATTVRPLVHVRQEADRPFDVAVYAVLVGSQFYNVRTVPCTINQRPDHHGDFLNRTYITVSSIAYTPVSPTIA
jgi:hypothetical protein